jgi:hypothetical protein
MKNCLGAVAVCIIISPLQSPAQEPSNEEKAMKLYDEAEVYYKLQNWQKALEKYEAAYLLSQQPELLFNIGQCYRQLGKYEEALRSYKTFLREVPNDPNRAEIQELIKSTEQLNEQSKVKPATTQATSIATSIPLSIPVELPASQARSWPLFVSASGATMGFVMGGLALSSRIKAEDAVISADPDTFTAKAKQAQIFGISSDVSMLLGLGAGVYSSKISPLRNEHLVFYSVAGVSALSAIFCSARGFAFAHGATEQEDALLIRQFSARGGAFANAADALWISTALWASTGFLLQRKHPKENLSLQVKSNSVQLSATF